MNLGRVGGLVATLYREVSQKELVRLVQLPQELVPFFNPEEEPEKKPLLELQELWLRVELTCHAHLIRYGVVSDDERAKAINASMKALASVCEKYMGPEWDAEPERSIFAAIVRGDTRLQPHVGQFPPAKSDFTGFIGLLGKLFNSKKWSSPNLTDYFHQSAPYAIRDFLVFWCLESSELPGVCQIDFTGEGRVSRNVPPMCLLSEGAAIQWAQSLGECKGANADSGEGLMRKWFERAGLLPRPTTVQHFDAFFVSDHLVFYRGMSRDDAESYCNESLKDGA